MKTRSPSRRMAPVAAAMLALAALAVPVSGTASAHHSFAAFDTAKMVEIKGVVVEFQWTNPHSWIEIDVPNAAGKVERWSIELNSPNNLSRQGWSRHDLKPGDKITLTLNPLRDGKLGGLFKIVTLADGRVHKDPSLRSSEPAAQ
ncbi:MAG: DUF6152 family protein [Hyphomonadaceae bacterium]|nr:DUF6152 family protein [Hyphomonadaceae bacterium]